MSRRSFLKGLGALALLAIPACRRAQQFAVEAADCPEWMLPGEATCFATSMPWGTGAIPMLAVCHNGVPTLLQSNPKYEQIQRGLPAIAQAALLDLYDDARPSTPTRASRPHTMQAIRNSLRAWSKLLSEGRNVAFLFPEGYSALRMAQVQELRRFSGASFYAYDTVTAARTGGFPELEQLQNLSLGPAVQFNHHFGTLAELTQKLPQLDLLFIFTPADPAAFSPEFAQVLESTPAETIRLHSHRPDTTAQLCLYTIPQTHFLEEWGADADRHGNLCLRQPVTQPLREAISEAEILHALLRQGETAAPPESTVPSAAYQWLEQIVPSLRESLADGYISAAAPTPQPRESKPAQELNWYLHPYYADGRFRHNRWLQENYLPLSGLAGAPEAFVPGEHSLCGLRCGGTELAARSYPGLHGIWLPLLPETTRATRAEVCLRPAPQVPHRPAKEQPPLTTGVPQLKTDGTSPQWALVIDLSRCTGCGACTLACRAENNIPTVGKEEQMYGRDLQWLRIERYLSRNGKLHYVPVACRHCEKAPCEAVCPVNATQHTTEGLSAMVYPRCWGTRYCAAACPYHARVFNFRDYAEQDFKQTHRPPNPRVTVRSRGVMEKCSYCVQRLNAAATDGSAPQTACQQACPNAAIQLIDICSTPLPASIITSFDAAGTRPRTIYIATT